MSYSKPIAVRRLRATSILTATALSLAFGAVASVPAESATTKRSTSSAAKVPGPVLHRIGVSHGGDAGSGVMVEEAWRDYAVAPRWHSRYESRSPRIEELEEWDTKEVGITAIGDLSLPVAQRVRAGRAYCRAPLPKDGELIRDERAPYTAASMKRELQPIQYVEALRHDQRARAALPAGPSIRGRATVTWTTDQLPADPSGFGVTWGRFVLDAATGEVLRQYVNQDVPEAWWDYTVWELLPAGTVDEARLAPPVAALRAAGCKDAIPKKGSPSKR